MFQGFSILRMLNPCFCLCFYCYARLSGRLAAAALWPICRTRSSGAWTEKVQSGVLVGQDLAGGGQDDVPAGAAGHAAHHQDAVHVVELGVQSQSVPR